MIVREVCGQDASQMPLAKDDDMLQALASHRANESLRLRRVAASCRREADVDA
jgi:hypothetical protein